MYLLDTDTLTHLYAGNTNVITRLNTVKDSEVGITIITKAEMLRGRIEYLIKAETDESLLRAQELMDVNSSSPLLPLLPISSAVSTNKCLN